MRYPVLAFCTLGLLGLIPLHGEPIDSLIGASDLLNIRTPGNPAISPDGKQIAYTVRGIETKSGAPDTYTSRTQLWLTAMDGRGGPHALTQDDRSAGSPAWSPTGDRLAYVQVFPGSARSRIWVLPLTGGAPYPVTPDLPAISSPRWSPDGSRLLCTAAITYDDVRAALEKNHAPDPSPAWPSERLLPPPAPAKETPKPGAKNPPPSKPEKPLPDPDGTLVERRAWLLDNETDNNPRVTWRLNFNDEGDGAPASVFTHVYSVAASIDSVPADLTPGYASYD